MSKPVEENKNQFKLDFWIPAILMALMVVVVMVQVVFRLMGRPIMWGEEVAKWMLIWIVFSGIGYAFKDGGLISVDFFVKRMRPATRKVVHLVDMGLIILYFGVLGGSAIHYARILQQKGQVFPITKVPAYFTVAAMVVGSLLAILYAVREIRRIAKTDYEKKEGAE